MLHADTGKSEVRVLHSSKGSTSFEFMSVMGPNHETNVLFGYERNTVRLTIQDPLCIYVSMFACVNRLNQNPDVLFPTVVKGLYVLLVRSKGSLQMTIINLPCSSSSVLPSCQLAVIILWSGSSLVSGKRPNYDRVTRAF